MPSLLSGCTSQEAQLARHTGYSAVGQMSSYNNPESLTQWENVLYDTLRLEFFQTPKLGALRSFGGFCKRKG